MTIALSIGAQPPFLNYIELLEGVADWLDREDFTERQLARFVALAEAEFNRVLRVPEMETSVMLAVEGEIVNLPPDFLQMRHIYQEGSPDSPLRGMSPDGLLQAYGGRSGVPSAYAIEGRALKLAPVGATILQIDYFRRIPALSDATPSNWLLDAHSDVYLFGTLTQAEAFTDNPARVGQWRGALENALGQVRTAGNRSRWGAEPLVPPPFIRQVAGGRC